MMDSKELLRLLCNADGPSGYEEGVRSLMRELMEKFVDEIQTDKLGTLVGIKKGTQEQPRVMLAAHMDEIGFIVRYITKEGYLKFTPLGGWMDQLILGQRVVIKTREGDVLGVIGCKPPHIVPPAERTKLIERKDMFIDVGVKSEEEVAGLGIKIGDPIVPYGPFEEMAKGKAYMGKGLDDRVGCALLIKILEEVGSDHPNTIYAAATVQEEVGLRGAQTAAYLVKPDVAIALEVAIAGDVPGVNPEDAQAKLGGGPVICLYDVSLIPNIRLRDLFIDTAKELGISYQFEIMEGGATDAGRIHLYAEGVPSIVIGVPTRHIHSPIGIMSAEDFENTKKLLIAVLKKLDSQTVVSLKPL
ncbi:M42 family metallopeptidase [bacterium]|nr:M42 family metallopeptidase [bacterium]